MDTSFGEHRARNLLSTLAPRIVACDRVAGRIPAEAVRIMSAIVAVFTIAVVYTVLVLMVGQFFAARTGKPGQQEKRDRLFTWRTKHHSSWMVGAVRAGAKARHGLHKAGYVERWPALKSGEQPASTIAARRAYRAARRSNPDPTGWKG